jgi:hypothetical protein
VNSDVTRLCTNLLVRNMDNPQSQGQTHVTRNIPILGVQEGSDWAKIEFGFKVVSSGQVTLKVTAMSGSL